MSAIETETRLSGQSDLSDLMGCLWLSDAAEPALVPRLKQRRQQQRRVQQPQLVQKGPGPNGRLQGNNPGKVARTDDNNASNGEELDETIQQLYEELRESGQRRRPQPSVEQIERDLREVAASHSPSPASVAAPSESSDDAEDAGIAQTSGQSPSASGDAQSETRYHQLARNRNPLTTVKRLHANHLRNCSFSDLLQPGLKAANQLGQTPLMLVVAQQHLGCVRYCCLFASTFDDLFPPLVEAALLPSDDIFYAVLQKLCLTADETSGAGLCWLLNRQILGWQFLNNQLNRFRGWTLEQLLHHANQTARLAAVRRAAQPPQLQQQQQQWRQTGLVADEPEDFLKKLLDQ